MSSFKAKLLNLKSQTQTSMDLGIDVTAGREMQGSLDDFRKAMKIRKVEMISSRNTKIQEQRVDRKITLSIRPPSLIAQSDRNRNKMMKSSEGHNDSSSVNNRSGSGSSSSSYCKSSKDSGSATNVDVIHRGVLSTDRNSYSRELYLQTNDPKTGKSINMYMTNNSVSTVECDENLGRKQITSNDVSNSKSSSSSSSNSSSSSSSSSSYSRSASYNKYSTEKDTMISKKNNEGENMHVCFLNSENCRDHTADRMRKNMSNCDDMSNINNGGESRHRSVTSGQNNTDSNIKSIKMDTIRSSNNSSSSSSSSNSSNNNSSNSSNNSNRGSNNSNNSSDCSSEYPSLDPQVLQVMRPHQLQAAIFLLNVLMGRTSNSDDVINISKECAEKTRTHLISTAYGENVLVDMNVNKNKIKNKNEDKSEAFRSINDTNKFDQNNDTKCIVEEHTQDDNSIPLTGAILADDMGTGKVRI